MSSAARYAPIARIGAGGQAEILLAKQAGASGFEKLVVIKRLLPHLAGDDRSRRRLEREALRVAELHHPNVCQVLDFIEDDDGPLLVLEFLHGVSAGELADDLPESREPQDVRLIAAVIQQACQGLQSAHTAELIHRDVSPANVLITLDGVAKILDFGIAQAGPLDRTDEAVLRGTLSYMSPEQTGGELLDHRSDQFSLAAVAFELLGGRPLHRRATNEETIAAIITAAPPSLAELQPAVPVALDQVIARALSKRPDDRFPGSREFGEAVAAAVAELGGPMRIPEIADVMAQRFGDSLGDRRRQLAAIASPDVPAKSKRADALPRVELSRGTMTTIDIGDAPADATPPPAPAPPAVQRTVRLALVVAIVALAVASAVLAVVVWPRGQHRPAPAVSAAIDAAPIDAGLLERELAFISQSDKVFLDGLAHANRQCGSRIRGRIDWPSFREEVRGFLRGEHNRSISGLCILVTSELASRCWGGEEARDIITERVGTVICRHGGPGNRRLALRDREITIDLDLAATGYMGAIRDFVGRELLDEKTK